MVTKKASNFIGVSIIIIVMFLLAIFTKTYNNDGSKDCYYDSFGYYCE
jgi:hypothetical protein